MFRKKGIVTFFASLIQAIIFQSVFAFEVEGPKEQIPINAISALIDPSGKLKFTDITSERFTNQFSEVVSKSQQADFGLRTDVIWLKVALSRKKEAAKTWILEIPYAGLSSVTLYNPDGDSVQLAPSSASNYHKPIYQRFLATPLDLATESQNYYLRIQSDYSISVPLIIWDAGAYAEAKIKDNFIQALYFGGLFTLAIYNLLIFFSLREKQFLFYFFLASFVGMGVFSGNGYGLLFLWPNYSRWDSISQSIFFSMGACFSLVFTQAYLKTKVSTPFYHKILSGFSLIFAVISLILAASLITKLDHQPFLLVYLFFVLASIPLIALTCIRKIFLGDPSAKYLLIAFSFLWIGGGIATLRALNLIESNGFTSYSVQIGSAFEMLLVSFALANQIKLDRNLRAKAEYRHETYLRHSSLISHEFRTPLNIIESQAALLSNEYKQGIDNLQSRVKTILSAVQHLSTLFTRWTQADKVKNFVSKPNITPIQLHTWLGNNIDWMRTLYSDHNLELEVDTSVENIAIDQELLQIALINLVDNACKYSPANSTISIGAITQNNMTGIYVKDEGLGIPKEEYSNIFKEYVRLKNDSKYRGLGLGLSLVEKIITLHAGRIDILSEIGFGTTITLWLPNHTAR